MPIPADLQAIPHWILWKSEHRGGAKPTKVPYSALTQLPCDVTDRSAYTSFENVINGHAVGFSGQGFCINDDDWVTAIDLDNPFERVIKGEVVPLSEKDPDALEIQARHEWTIKHFNSYTERSPSGKGYRIIIRGKLPPGFGTRNSRWKIEVYSRDRFVTMTGDHVEGTPTTIEHRQAELEYLASEIYQFESRIDSTYISNVASAPVTKDDTAVISEIYHSKHAPKIWPLWSGDTSAYNNDPSSAEQALADYIVWFTQNREQVERIFRAAPLTQRPKVQTDRPDYVARTIDKAFDRSVPTMNYSEILAANTSNAGELIEETNEPPMTPIERPPGLLGDIADFMYRAAPHPIAEFAVAGAVALLSAFCGRAYNVNGSGLNHYIVVIGKSGIGKDSVSQAMNRLITEVAKTHPGAQHFMGPRAIMSMQALRRRFEVEKGGSPSFVSIVGEFGEWLLSHMSERADANKRMLIADIMMMFSESAEGVRAGSMAYADSDKDVKAAISPALTLLGDTVPGSFYEACTVRNITKGFIPRLNLFEYVGKKPYLNANHFLVAPDTHLIERLTNLADYCMKANQRNVVQQVTMTPEIEAAYMAYNRQATDRFNDCGDDAVSAIWSRAPLKALKMAALVAVGRDWFHPVITSDDFAYGVRVAERDVTNLQHRIQTGEVETHTVSHTGDHAGSKTIARILLAQLEKPYAKLHPQIQRTTTAKIHDEFKMFPQSRLRNLCLGQAPWRSYPSRVQAGNEFNSVLADMDNVCPIRTVASMSQLDPAHIQASGFDGTTPFVWRKDVKGLKAFLE